MRTSTSKQVILNGYIVNEEGEKLDKRRYVSLEDGKIKYISTKKPSNYDSAITLELADDEVIFPGFLDLHTHIEYNMIPNWDSKLSPWDNRHEWRNNKDYHKEISDVHKYIMDNWSSKYSKTVDDFRILGEIQAISGGSTVLQETEAYSDTSKDPIVRESDHLLIRSTGRGEDLGLEKDRLIFSVIDFYKPHPRPDGDSHLSTKTWKPVEQEKLTFFKKEMGTDFIDATLVHLAEGRTGFLKDDCDSYTRNEFERFMSEMSSNEYSPEEVQKHNISIIHGCGIDSENDDHMKFLKDYGISILWAPISNTLLYSDTINVLEFLNQGVNVALGSDWSPSGGKHVWDEAKFAYDFCKAKYPEISSEKHKRTIYKMITTNAVKCLGNDLKLGKIKEDYSADFIIFKMEDNHQSALDALFEGNDDSVSGVIVNGRIIYGDQEIYERLKLDFEKQMKVDYQPLPASDGSFAAKKCISINSELNFDINKSTVKIDNLLKKEKWNRSKYLSSDDIAYQKRLIKLKKDLGIETD